MATVRVETECGHETRINVRNRIMFRIRFEPGCEHKARVRVGPGCGH
jgi:hypothetical protein